VFKGASLASTARRDKGTEEFEDLELNLADGPVFIDDKES
jgi:hypothetical protein